MFVTSVRPPADRPPVIPAQVLALKRAGHVPVAPPPKKRKMKMQDNACSPQEVALKQLMRTFAPLEPASRPSRPQWSLQHKELGDSLYSQVVAEKPNINGAAALIRALRFSLALNIADSAWLVFLKDQLSLAVHKLSADEEF